MSDVMASNSTEENSFQLLVDIVSNVLKDGRPEEAQRACRGLTETHPEQPNSWFLYGVTALESGDATAAIPALERATAMHRANAGYRRTLGRAYRSAGRNEDAATALEHALRLAPDHAEALLTLGLIRIAQGAKEAGVPLCRRGFMLGIRTKWRQTVIGVVDRLARVVAQVRFTAKPRDERPVWDLYTRGKFRERLGDRDGALGLYQQTLELSAEHLPALKALSRLHGAKEEFAAALPLLESATVQEPHNTTLQIDHARALSGTQQFDKAVGVLENLFNDVGESPRALLAFGRAQSGAGDAAAAQEAYKRALALAPNSAEAHFAIGRNLQEDGRIEEANRYFLDTLEIDPRNANAYRFLASNKAFNADDETFARMLKLLENDDISQKNRIRLHFAAATVFEQAGDIDNAYTHLSAGNDLKNVIFDPEYCVACFGNLIETFDEDFFNRTRGWGSEDERPVFIVGMPRSGTTLVEQILASHGDVFGAGELESFNQFVNGLSARIGTDAAYPDCAAKLTRDDVTEMAADHLAALHALAPSARHVTDKMPTNFLHIGLILALYPNARIIHCRRDPRDTCFSIFGLDFAGEHTYAYDQTNLGRFYRQYERLMDHWRHVAPGSIIDVQYEALIADQEPQTRRLLEFCGLEWDARCLEFHKTDRTVRTWSYNQVRQPIYKSSVARWWKFEAYLKPLLDELDVREPEEECA